MTLEAVGRGSGGAEPFGVVVGVGMVAVSASAASGRVRRVVAEGVGRMYGRTVALRGVDVIVEAGEVVSIEGPNGSGKSTLLGIVGTRIRPTVGSVQYEPGGGSLVWVRRQIGWVAHETLAYPDLSTRKNVELAAALYGVDPERAWKDQCARFGLERFGERTVRQQSRGQRQRTALARALVHTPSVLLLDEPSSGLDPEGVKVLVEVIEEEARRGCVVLMVTHDGGLAERVACRRLRLEGGRLGKVASA